MVNAALQRGAEAEADERADRSDRSCVRIENESEWPKRTIRNILRNSTENAVRENTQTLLPFLVKYFPRYFKIIIALSPTS